MLTESHTEQHESTETSDCTHFSKIFQKHSTPPTHLKPFHIRLKEYNAKRAEIFNESTPTMKQKRSLERIRNFWQNVNRSRRGLLSTVYEKQTDFRPYADVQLFGKKISGLLDTGASISCLGSQAAKEFLESDENFKRIKSAVRTADGNAQEVVGFKKTQIIFRGVSKDIVLYIVPTLAQD